MIKLGQLFSDVLFHKNIMGYSVSELKNLYLVSGANSFNSLVRQLYKKNTPGWRVISLMAIDGASTNCIQNSIRLGFLYAYPEVFRFNRSYLMPKWLSGEVLMSNKVKGIDGILLTVKNEDNFILSLFDFLIAEYGDRKIEFKFENGNSIP